MEKRLVLFLVLSFALVLGQSLLLNWLWGPPPKQPAKPAVAAKDQPAAGAPGDAAKPEGDPDDAVAEIVVQEDAQAQPDTAPGGEAGEATPADGAVGPTPDQAAAAPAAEPPPAPPVEAPPRWITLGSADPKSPYRMVVTLTNAGAAVECLELNEARFRALAEEAPGGYLGYLAPGETDDLSGVVVRAVAAGTPAAAAGIAVGDRIEKVAGERVRSPSELAGVLRAKTKPRQSVPVELRRGDQPLTVQVALIRPPLEVIHPEGSDPLSFLCTFDQIDDASLGAESEELPGLALRTTRWEVARAEAEVAEFRLNLPGQGLEVVKRFRLDPLPADEAARDKLLPGYHLSLELEVRRTTKKTRTVAYRLDGPTGLPIEGEWYASKISRTWSGTGIRDVVVGFRPNGRLTTDALSALSIAGGELDDAIRNWQDKPVVYLGVDAQYFASALLPVLEEPDELRFSRALPLRVGPVPADKAKHKLVNTSCRLVSRPLVLDEEHEAISHRFLIFAGPKRPAVLDRYGLGDLNQYGWFGWVARPMLGLLHIFYRVVGNYGIAIVMLTVVVRLSMFPLSRAQLKNAQKMSELQPELKKLADKYKNNLEARSKAQQDLFKKHGYNPFSGCLPLVIQMPIFIGLYRSLSVDVELRQAPLFWEGVAWCSNLAAPDMLFRWEAAMPGFVLGWLGPYFNLLPLFTVGLFLVQQKMLMPPPADEQARVQQQTMQIMTVFMGVLFFKVASGLCLYFIASSLWGLAEKKLLPQTVAARAPVAAR